MITKNNDDKYADIIDLPHHVSKHRPHMSMQARAGQFAPFAALKSDTDYQHINS